MSRAPSRSDAAFAPLSITEQARLRAVLDPISTYSLLMALFGMDRDSPDAQLIVAALLDRLPSGAG